MKLYVESSIIIEHLALHHPGPVRLLSDDPRGVAEARAQLDTTARAVDEARPYRADLPLGAPDRD